MFPINVFPILELKKNILVPKFFPKKEITCQSFPKRKLPFHLSNFWTTKMLKKKMLKKEISILPVKILSKKETSILPVMLRITKMLQKKIPKKEQSYQSSFPKRKYCHQPSFPKKEIYISLCNAICWSFIWLMAHENPVTHDPWIVRCRTTHGSWEKCKLIRCRTTHNPWKSGSSWPMCRTAPYDSWPMRKM